MPRQTNSLSTRQRLGFVISQVLAALHGLVLSVKLIGSKVMKQKQKDEIIISIIGSVILLTVLYYFVKAIVGFDN